MSNEDIEFVNRYKELLDKGYCNCNEMNCIDNNSPRRILNIVNQLQQENRILKDNAVHNDKVVDGVNWKNKELQSRISKAIEYIENDIAYIELNFKDTDCFENDLLSILKGNN